MQENKDNRNKTGEETEQLSLNDDRRVQVLSPGTLVAKRFFRNRLAIVGLSVLVVMFVFSFLGGAVSPHGQDELFYRVEYMNKEYVGVSENSEYRYLKFGDDYSSVLQAQTVLAIQKKADSFTYKDAEYGVVQEGDGLYSIYSGNTLIGAAYLDIVQAEDSSVTFSAEFQYNALKAYVAGGGDFKADGGSYSVDADGIITQGSEGIAALSRYVVQSRTSGTVISTGFREALMEALDAGLEAFDYTENGETAEYTVVYDAYTRIWSVNQETATRVLDTYASPTGTHWLGTDRNGMDMLTRLMYGGRVSLIIGFIVVLISSVLEIGRAHV